MGTDTVRRGGTRGARMNGHLCLVEEWLEQEEGKTHRNTSSTATQKIIQVSI